jgi:DNA-binding beta-propeller fold protein YncE
MFALAAIVVGLNACGSSGESSSSKALTPRRILSLPSGVIGVSAEQQGGTMWVLAGTKGAKNLRPLNVASGSLAGAVPVSSSAVAVSESSSGLLSVGLSTQSTGALQIRSGSSGALLSTIPIGAPVQKVAAGSDGSSFYVLNGNARSSSVTVLNAVDDKVDSEVPVPLGTAAVAPTASESSVYAVQPNGTLSLVNVSNGQLTSAFVVGSGATSLALSPDGSTMYVLRVLGSITEVAVVDLNTESVVRTLPAPSGATALELSPDGTSLYEVVDTATGSNLQIYTLSNTKT